MQTYAITGWFWSMMAAVVARFVVSRTAHARCKPRTASHRLPTDLEL